MKNTPHVHFSLPFSADELVELSYPNAGRFHIDSLNEATKFCKHLALQHYENFPVGSLLIPRRLQPHFYSVYAFARLADDIADELYGIEQSPEDNTKIDALRRLGAMLDSLYTSSNAFSSDDQPHTHPVFRALSWTVGELGIPADPFRRLLTAFQMDANFRQASSWSDLEHYCAHSANPIGELVLRIYNLCTLERVQLSNAICTGLQLVNFWQDFSRDIPRGRLFIPATILQEHRLPNDDVSFYSTRLEIKKHEEQVLRCLSVLFEQTKLYFAHGKHLLATIPDIRLRMELAFTIAGGILILHKSRRLGIRIFHERPKLLFRDMPALIVWCLSALA